MDYIQIGRRIRNIRKSKNMTQEKLAEIVDISLTHMSHIETGSTKLSLPVLAKISKALNTSTDELLFGKAQPLSPVTLNRIAELFEHCSTRDICIMTDILLATKATLDKNR